MSNLAEERYINLESFKKDGNGVKTPVWCAPLDGKIVVFTEGESFKVKRIRRNPNVRVAKCDVRGKVLGPWSEATCVVLSDHQQEERAYAVLRRKYGLQMRVLDFFSGLAGKKKKRAVLEISVKN
ncbi:MAG: PPOX class F420-dependent oxidoreductase [Myxococcales bacterium]